jgi:RNA polymerase sigma factor (sigma-70 family)
MVRASGGNGCDLRQARPTRTEPRSYAAGAPEPARLTAFERFGVAPASWGVIDQLGGLSRVGPRLPEQAQAEREAAFDRLTQARLERAYRLASLLLRDQSEAEDAVHDAAVRAWTRWADLRDQDSFEAWFDRIVVSRCRDRMRRNHAAPMSLPQLEPAAGDEPERVIVERDNLRRALAALGPDHRIVVVLRFVDDMSVPSIAAMTGEREGTVKSRLHYALRQIRAAYDASERAEGSQR